MDSFSLGLSIIALASVGALYVLGVRRALRRLDEHQARLSVHAASFTDLTAAHSRSLGRLCDAEGALGQVVERAKSLLDDADARLAQIDEAAATNKTDAPQSVSIPLNIPGVVPGGFEVTSEAGK